jgi:FAD/FMN-containing dehydrogenase
MTDLIGRTLSRIGQQLRGRLSLPGDDRYAAATAIWAKPVGRKPRAVVHCRTPEDAQLGIRAARQCDLPLSVRGGGHDWAGRALCDGIVLDLRSMNAVAIDSRNRTARIPGGARAADVIAMTDPVGLAAVTGSVGAVGMAGLTLGNTARQQRGRDVLCGRTDGVRPVSRERATSHHGDLVDTCTRRPEYRCLHPSHGGCRLPRLRHLYARVQRRSLPGSG